jgi:hypothetical protein
VKKKYKKNPKYIQRVKKKSKISKMFIKSKFIIIIPLYPKKEGDQKKSIKPLNILPPPKKKEKERNENGRLSK